jgi:hypothetical protein
MLVALLVVDPVPTAQIVHLDSQRMRFILGAHHGIQQRKSASVIRFHTHTN